MKSLTKAVVVAAAALLASTLFASAASAGSKWVGALVVEQSPQVDQIAAGRNESEYFMPIYRKLSAGTAGFRGVTGPVTLVLRNGPSVIWSTSAQLRGGVAYVEIPAEMVRGIITTTALCIQLGWIPVHQTLRPRTDDTACTAGDYLHRTLIRENRANSREDASGVIAIKPAG